MIREEQIEQYLHQRVVARLGGKTYKWTSPGCIGVPDRIVLWRGQVCFVEVKQPKGRVAPIQKARMDELTDLGHKTRVVSSKEEVDELIEWLCQI